MIDWNTEQKELRGSIKKWSSAFNQPAVDSDDVKQFYRSWEVIKDTGLLALPIESRYGGLGKDILTTMYVMEAFGEVCEDAGLSFSTASHLVSTAIPIQRFGSDAQKDRFLADLVSGEKIAAHAITEPDTGSDAWSMKSQAYKNEDGSYTLNGSKAFISNGPVADTFVVYARTNAKLGTLGGFTAFIIDRDTPGFTVGKPLKKMGLHSSMVSDLYFDNCLIAEDRILGKVGQGFSIFNFVMNWEILLSFIINVGEMQNLLQKCITYCQKRKQYGKAIGEFQAISHKIANMKIGVETSKTMLYKTALAFSRGSNITVDLAIAKIVTSEAFVSSALDAIQIFGGAGYMEDQGIEKFLRNAVASRIYSGTSEIQRNTIASMLGL